MPLLYIAVIDLCFILDVDVPLIFALITAVYRILTFIEKRFDQRETRQSCDEKQQNLQRSEVSEALMVDRLDKLQALQRMGSYKMRQFIKNGNPESCRF